MLRTSGLLATAIGGLGSVALTLYTGRRNPSPILMALFAIWVLSPFVALAAADLMSKQWSVLMRTALYALMLVITADTLVVYGYIALGPPRAQTARTFLLVPPASWLLMTIVLRVAAVIASRRPELRVLDR